MSDLSFLGGFNADEHEMPRDDAPLPAGGYYLEVENIDLKQTANGQGTGANVQFDVLGDEQGNHTGRKCFVWFNLQHSNEQAQKVGQAQFAELCKACGIITPQDTDELLGSKIFAKVSIDKKDATKNNVRGFKAIEAATNQTTAPAQSAAHTPPPSQTPPPAAPAAAKPKMPWEQ